MATRKKPASGRAARRSRKERTPVYNEPLRAPRGDSLPRVTALKVKQLSAAVRARLEVERVLSSCGNSDARRSFVYTAARRRALLAILAENDSPVSAALRADAASVAGALKDAKLTAAVRRIALDDTEDLETRLSAVDAYITAARKNVSKDILSLLKAKDLRVRQVAYLSALRSPVREHVALATERFAKQRNRRVRSVVTKRIPELQQGTTVPAK